MQPGTRHKRYKDIVSSTVMEKIGVGDGGFRVMFNVLQFSNPDSISDEQYMYCWLRWFCKCSYIQQFNTETKYQNPPVTKKDG